MKSSRISIVAAIAAALFVSLPFASGADQNVCVKADGTIRGPFTHDEPLAAGENRVVLTKDQYLTLDAFRRSNPLAAVAFDGRDFTLAPVEVAKRAEVAQREALVAKLEEGALGDDDLRALVKSLVLRIQKLEAAK